MVNYPITRRWTALLPALALALFVTGCGQTAAPATSPKKGGTTTAADGGKADTTVKSGTAVTGSSVDVLKLWCEKAAQTDAVKNKVNDLYGRLCSSNGPTTMLTTKLISNAYAGSGTPVLISKKISSSGNNTTADFNVGIKLPITAKKHFDVVGPKGGQPDDINKLAAAQQAVGTAEILKTFAAGEDQFLTRGWLIHSTTTKKVVLIDVKQDSQNVASQYDFNNSGKDYMYVQYVDKAIEGVTAFSLLTANVQLGDQAYLLASIHVIVDNHGFGDVATKTIESTATGLVKTMYNGAANAQ